MALEAGVPLELRTKGLSAPEERLAKALVGRYVLRLVRIAPDLSSCRVVVERPMKFQDSGNPFRVRIRAAAPGHAEVVVIKDAGQHEMHDPLQRVLKDAFRSAARSLEGRIDRMRGDVKQHGPVAGIDDDLQPGIGIVVRLHRAFEFGFLRTEEGREVYFHANAVLDGFETLRVGAEVRFEAEQGEDGPQATSLRIVSHHGPREEPFGVVEDPEGWRRDEVLAPGRARGPKD